MDEPLVGRAEGAVAAAQAGAHLFTWDALKPNARNSTTSILAWADALDAGWLAGEITWFSGIAQKDVSAPKWMLLTHFFNHQTHHRGQAHAMLTPPEPSRKPPTSG